MSVLTDNQFNPSAERIWLFMLAQRWESGPAINLRKADFGKKKVYFQMKLILILAGM